MSDRLCRIVLGLIVVMGLAVRVFGDIELLKDGGSKYAIVLNPDASPSEKFAADEFQLFFEKCTSVKLPIHHRRGEKNRAYDSNRLRQCC